MREVDVEKFRKKYKELDAERQKRLKIKEELAELEKDENVKRYIKLSKSLDPNYREVSEEQIINDAFSSIRPIMESNNIMVHIGTYVSRLNSDYVTYDNNPDASYKVYLDLETEQAHKIPLDEYREFEEKYLVLYVPVATYNYNEYMKKYNELKMWFRKEIITRSQEEVIRELREEHKIRYQQLYDEKHPGHSSFNFDSFKKRVKMNSTPEGVFTEDEKSLMLQFTRQGKK